jgi:hypothetical protein
MSLKNDAGMVIVKSTVENRVGLSRSLSLCGRYELVVSGLAACLFQHFFDLPVQHQASLWFGLIVISLIHSQSTLHNVFNLRHQGVYGIIINN